jgi:hypothetical protein
MEVTGDGLFSLREGHDPDHPVFVGSSEPAVPAEPRTPYGERPVARARRAKVQELIEQPVAEGCVRFADSDDDGVAELRCVVNYAKRHGRRPPAALVQRITPRERGRYAALGKAAFVRGKRATPGEGVHRASACGGPDFSADRCRRLMDLTAVRAA